MACGSSQLFFFFFFCACSSVQCCSLPPLVSPSEEGNMSRPPLQTVSPLSLVLFRSLLVCFSVSFTALAFFFFYCVLSSSPPPCPPPPFLRSNQLSSSGDGAARQATSPSNSCEAPRWGGEGAASGYWRNVYPSLPQPRCRVHLALEDRILTLHTVSRPRSGDQRTVPWNCRLTCPRATAEPILGLPAGDVPRQWAPT